MTLIRALLMRRRPLVTAVAVIALTVAAVPRSPGDEPAAGNNPAPTTSPAVDPRAEELLRAAAKYLGDAKSLSFTADVWEDAVSPTTGRKLQSQRSVDVAIRRPDRIVAHRHSDLKARDAYYDGKSLTIYDPTKNLYGVMTDVPHTIDETVDYVADHFGMSMPLADLIVTDLHRDVSKNIQQGDYLGLQNVAGAKCHHLGFIQEDVDWQLWIEEGRRPLIRKLVITYKNQDQSPQFTATISDWQFNFDIPDYAFQFRAPAGASRIAVLPAKPTEEQPGAIPAGAKESPPAPPTGAPPDGAKPPQSGSAQPPAKE